VNALDEVPGVERVDLAGAGGAAAQGRGGAHPTLGPEDHRAARRAVRIGPVADAEAGDGGEARRCHVAHATAKI